MSYIVAMLSGECYGAGRTVALHTIVRIGAVHNGIITGNAFPVFLKKLSRQLGNRLFAMKLQKN